MIDVDVKQFSAMNIHPDELELPGAITPAGKNGWLKFTAIVHQDALPTLLQALELIAAIGVKRHKNAAVRNGALLELACADFLSGGTLSKELVEAIFRVYQSMEFDPDADEEINDSDFESPSLQDGETTRDSNIYWPSPIAEQPLRAA